MLRREPNVCVSKGLSRKGVLHDISFQLRAGEIVGLGGLVGAGRTELCRALFGIDPMIRDGLSFKESRSRCEIPDKRCAQASRLYPRIEGAMGWLANFHLV